MLQKLMFKPGINRENTDYANEGGWYDMDKVRFRFGTPEKIGGWKAAAADTFQGIARSLLGWATHKGELLIGVGTSVRYYINYGGAFRNITPTRATVNLTNPFLTTANQSLVRVFAAAHGVAVGDNVVFANAASVAGISDVAINNPLGYQVVSIIDRDTYTVDFKLLATVSTQGGGNVQANYEIGAGLPVYTIGSGWGAGGWNAAITGAASTVLAGNGRTALNAEATTLDVVSTANFSASGLILVDAEVISYTGTTGTSFTGCTRGSSGSTAAVHNRRQINATDFAPINVTQVLGLSGNTGWGAASDTSFGVGTQLRLWSNATFTEDLILCPRGGTLYYWRRDIVTFNRAFPLRVAGDSVRRFVPHTVNALLVSDVSRFVMALGANPYDETNPDTVFDPMLVRWSAQNEPSNWVPRSTNQSGEVRLSAGSYIMSGVNMKQEMLIWTDAALYSMQYVGPDLVWKTELSMSNLSLIGPNATAIVNNNAFWMGTDKFYVYNGRVDTLPCSVQQYVFNDISFAQRFQTFAGTNEGFNEVWWFYVSNTEVLQATFEGRDPLPDRYVIYNHAEQVWYYGSMRRTAWTDTALLPGPLATVGTVRLGRMVMHEQGTNDGTVGQDVPINAYIHSADFDIGDGHQFMFITRMLPDISFNGSTVPNPIATVELFPRQSTGSDRGTSRQHQITSAQLYNTDRKQYTVQQFTPQIDTRVRGRQMSLRVESNTLGVQWKLGAPRIDVRPDGRKS